MKKIAVIMCAFALLTGCAQKEYNQPACPSCDPPARHYEVVTECSDYVTQDLGNATFSQCRYCYNKIYANGVDVTDYFKGKKAPKKKKCGKSNRKLFY